MKLKILMKFRDRNTGTLYNVGDEVEFDEKRANELLADKRNLVEKILTVEKKATTEKVATTRNRKKKTSK
jgi:hypothetical protein